MQSKLYQTRPARVLVIVGGDDWRTVVPLADRWPRLRRCCSCDAPLNERASLVFDLRSSRLLCPPRFDAPAAVRAAGKLAA